ncbi:MAG: glycosyltransferase family 2 protein [Acidobacteria bacterium]|nr:glycosyltransferase family 2 protein [Acidobacteriota bacterium]
MIQGHAALIIPALNEAECLPSLFDAIPPDLFRWIIVADNGSTDRTAGIARERGAIVVSEPERGYGAASLKAMAVLPAEAEVVVWMQADLSENPGEAELLLAPIRAGEADLVIGSRTMGEAARGALLPHQVFGNDLACFLMRMFWGHRYTDLGPFRAIRRDALERMAMEDRNYGWTIEMQIKALQLGLRVREVPVRYGKRIAGENKVSGNWKASARAGWIILRTVFRHAVRVNQGRRPRS